MVCAWCEATIDGAPVELHRGPIPYSWRKGRAGLGTARSISAAAEAFAGAVRVAQGREDVEHYTFHPECWEKLAQLLGGRP